MHVPLVPVVVVVLVVDVVVIPVDVVVPDVVGDEDVVVVGPLPPKPP
jgi:hypothetical protein